MSGPNFAELLRIEEELLASQLRSVRAAVRHAGEKGRGLEHHALRLLRRLLPSEFGLTTGFVACALGSNGDHKVVLSPQIDVIIYDAIRGAPVVDLGSSHVLPIECVHAVVEVKASFYRDVGQVCRWSKEVRKLKTRHYLVAPKRVDFEEEHRKKFSNAPLGDLDQYLRDLANQQMFPPPKWVTREWAPIRCFALAFEYDTERRFTLDAARKRFADQCDGDVELHAIFVPDTCVLWTSNTDPNAGQIGGVGGTARDPLATFRHRLLDALSSFPRPGEGSTMDLRPYFDSPTS